MRAPSVGGGITACVPSPLGDRFDLRPGVHGAVTAALPREPVDLSASGPLPDGRLGDTRDLGGFTGGDEVFGVQMPDVHGTPYMTKPPPLCDGGSKA